MSDVRPIGPLLFPLMIANYLTKNKFMAYELKIFCFFLVVVMQQANQLLPSGQSRERLQAKAAKIHGGLHQQHTAMNLHSTKILVIK